MSPYQFELLEQVRVKPLGFFSRLVSGRDRRRMAGLTARVTTREIGRYTQQPVYTVMTDDKRIGSFYTRELLPS